MEDTIKCTFTREQLDILLYILSDAIDELDSSKYEEAYFNNICKLRQKILTMLPVCDICLCEFELSDKRYYANGNQEGKICHDCHIREMMHSNDTF